LNELLKFPHLQQRILGVISLVIAEYSQYNRRKLADIARREDNNVGQGLAPAE